MKSLYVLAVFSLLAAACGATGGADGSGDGVDGGATGPTTDSGAIGNDGGTSTPTGDSGTSANSDAATVCTPYVAPKCDAAAPAPGAKRSWVHTTASPIVTLAGSANHRGRDLFVNPGAPQWIIGKFAYGLADKDLKDEDVDIYLNRGCGATWEKLATVRTTNENAHATVEGMEDTGGRVYYEIPAAKALGPGRHRVRLVVGGDLTATELFIEVIPQGAPMFVTDVDGTLTSSETAEFQVLLTGALPDIHVDAPEALSLLAAKGYRPMYVTARPEWLVERTREFVAQKGLPPGIIHTTTGLTGATGTAAVTYKTGEIEMIKQKGLKPTFVFGNTDSDATAYESAGVQPLTRRYFYQFTDAAHGGRRIEAYTELLPEFTPLAAVCR